jgi:hypothetical protein
MPYYRDSDEESILSDDRGESPRRSVDETNNPDFIRELFERHERRKNRYDSDGLTISRVFYTREA